MLGMHNGSLTLQVFFIIVDDPVISAARLNTDLEKISRWATTWLVTFNPSKSECLSCITQT